MASRPCLTQSILSPFRNNRTFTTSPSLSGKKPKTNILRLLPKDAPSPPPYPYAPRHHWYKQAQRGLYGGSKIQHGNNVSEQNEIKTRRTFLPNVQTKRVFSRALNRWLYIRLTTRVLRTIDKVGGVDNYVLGQTSARLKSLGGMGWDLRWVILQTKWAKETLGEASWKRLVEGVGEGRLDIAQLKHLEAVAVDGVDGEEIEGAADDDVLVELGDVQAEEKGAQRDTKERFMDEAPAPPRSMASNLS